MRNSSVNKKSYSSLTTYLCSRLESRNFHLAFNLLFFLPPFGLLFDHDPAILGWIISLKLPHFVLGLLHVLNLLLGFLLFVQLLVGLRDVVLPKVQKASMFFTPTIEIDAHSAVVLFPQELCQSFNMLWHTTEGRRRLLNI